VGTDATKGIPAVLGHPTGADWVDRYADENGLELLLLEPRVEYDACIIGVVERFNQHFVLYSKRKVLSVIAQQLGDMDDAIEWFDFNTNGGWYGDATWGFLDDELEER